MHHRIEVESSRLPTGRIRLDGRCSCGAWLELVVDPNTHVACGPMTLKKWHPGPPLLVIGSALIGYPPCFGIHALERHYTKELS